MANSHKHDFFVCDDQLCDTCLSVSFWLSGSGWPNSRTRRDEPGSRENEKQDKGATGRMTEERSSHRRRPFPGRRISAWQQGVTAESLKPTPTPTHAAQADGGRCLLSEAFERAVRIEGDGGAPDPADDWLQEEDEDNEWSGEVGEDDGVGHVRIRERKAEYGPSRPLHFPADDSGKRFGGSPSRLGGHGRHSRTSRRTAGNKKRVRLARKAEVVRFRGDSATNTLGSLGREYKACH